MAGAGVAPLASRGGKLAGDAWNFAMGHRFARFCLRSNADGVTRRVVAVAHPDLAGIGAGDEQRRRRVRVLDGDGATACSSLNGRAGRSLSSAASTLGTSP